MPTGWPYIMMCCWMINIQYLPNITIHNTTYLAHFVISSGFSNGKDRSSSPYFPTYTLILHDIKYFSKNKPATDTIFDKLTSPKSSPVSIYLFWWIPNIKFSPVLSLCLSSTSRTVLKLRIIMHGILIVSLNLP